ncbi:hypothetical protein OH77DRAFT_1420671 [Trametes cingulata]|nr:hypothetical protein OH77DRAFT_1420671 [Trametes cingulata]
MLWPTYFSCDCAEYNSYEYGGGQASTADIWRPVRVSICEVTANNRWLIVIAEAEAQPVVWRVIKDDWSLTCDEQTLSLSMQRTDSSTAVTTVQTIRFRHRHEFWSLVGNMSFARLRTYSAPQGHTTRNSGDQEVVSTNVEITDG